MTGSATRRWMAAMAGAVVLIALGFSPSARAAGWLAPADVSTPQSSGSSSCGFLAGQPGVAAVDVAVNDRGDAVAVWTRRDGTTRTVQAAVRAAGGTFGAPQTIGIALPCYFLGILGSAPKVGIDAEGNAVAVWAKPLAATNVIQGAVRLAGAAFGPSADLSDPSRSANTDPDVAVSANGAAVAVWTWNDGAHTVIQSAARPRGGSFPRGQRRDAFEQRAERDGGPRRHQRPRGRRRRLDAIQWNQRHRAGTSATRGRGLRSGGRSLVDGRLRRDAGRRG